MNFVLKIMIILLNFIYVFMKLFPCTNKIVMISRQSNNVTLDFELLGNMLSKKYKIIYLCKTLDGGIRSKISVKIKYGFHMFCQMFHLATSKVCVLDSYCPTVSILKHKKGLVVIQMWHSIGTMKKFGYAILDTEEGTRAKLAKIMHMHENYNIVMAASKAYQKDLASGFNCDEKKFVIKTLPRVDLLLNKDYELKIKSKIYKEYPKLRSKKNILYCPTFRKNENKLNKAIIDLINKIDYSKYNLIIKLHPLSKIQISTNEVIVDKKFSTFEMLFIADKVISDYSCIIYEAGIRKIPIYFYNFDINDYKVKRGLAIDYNELPGYTKDIAEELIKTFDLRYDYNYLNKFIDKYVTNKKNCTKEIAKLISGYMK